MPEINNSNSSNDKQKELKIKLGQLQEEISEASLPVSADLSNDFKSIIFETNQRNISPFITLFCVNLFSSDKCFIYFISDVPHYI